MSETPESDQASPQPSTKSDNTPTDSRSSSSSSDAVNQAPGLQAQGIRALRLISQTLGSFADRWEKNPAPGRSSSSTEPLPFEETLDNVGKTLSDNWPGIQTRLQDLWGRLQPLLLRLEELWLPYLAKLKARLPESLTQLPDRTLTGILAGLLVVTLWFFNGLLHPHPAIAQAPTPGREIAQRPIAQPITRPVTRIAEPARSPSDAVAYQPLDPQAPIAKPIPRKSSPSTNRGTDATSKLQQAFTDVSTPYVEDLILSVLPDSSARQVTLKVSSAWYDLESKEQDQLADAFVHSSQRLKFDKLEIKDSQNELVARTPVVGDQIVILRRHRVTTS
jgi:hypothetical protein